MTILILVLLAYLLGWATAATMRHPGDGGWVDDEPIGYTTHDEAGGTR